MDIEEDISLRKHNTFGIDCRARYFTTATSAEDLRALRQTEVFRTCGNLVLGGGSNVLFTGDFDGLIIHNEMLGKEVIDEDGKHIWLRVRAGENWHELVGHCVENGWGGIENLALIPGCVGAAPIQNIGAYGVELKDVLVSVEVFEWATGDIRVYFNEDCRFGYRDSIFKQELKGKVVVAAITIKLARMPEVNTAYGAIREVLEQKDISNPRIADVYRAVIDIRRSKLPDPAEIGNAGSFFKNPELPKAEAEAILQAHPGAPHYIVDEQTIKIPAGWLIEQCGWKGSRRGQIGVHDRQALVLVNHGGGKGTEIRDLAMEILESVKEKFGVELTPEVNIV